jgi:hypothetical protein
MERLGRVIAEAIVHHYGRDELLRRLAHPFWFQSFGAVMGMDWHSSGITTSVMGALKRGLGPLAGELGLHVCGGRGRHSRQTPAELLAVGERVGIDGADLARISRLVAKVDNSAIQDSFQLYLHSFVVTDTGAWAVVQQGMNGERRQARRYHWLSEGLEDFVDQPHSAIDGPFQGEIVNLTDRRAAPARGHLVELARHGPDRVLQTLRALRGQPELEGMYPEQPRLRLPARHAVHCSDVELARLHGALAAAAERGPADFPDLLLTPGVGVRTVSSLALVSEVIHGAPCRFSDPARFSLAHGGKDGHPFPVPLEVYDRTLAVMRQALEAARLGNEERLGALRRLDEQARWLEHSARGPALPELISQERRHSEALGGRSVFGQPPGSRSPRRRPDSSSPKRSTARTERPGDQLTLPGLEPL